MPCRESLVTGERFPEWHELPEPTREAWRAAADAVEMVTKVRDQYLIYPAELTQELMELLGRPCFACAKIAEKLRLGGWKIATKAEHEQAAVLHFSLKHYLRDSANWMDNANGELAAMVAHATEGGGE